MDRVDVIKGVASQRVYFYPPEGRPTSTPSVSIKDSGGSTVTAAATTYVTLDSVSTTVSVAGAVGDKTLTLTSVTGLEVGVTYLVTNSLGQKEWVRVRGFSSSTRVVTVDEPLEYAHDTAATFVGTRFYRTLQTGEVDELAELYRARATYTVNSLNYVLEVPFDVVLTPLPNLLTIEFVKKHRPDIMSQEFTETRGTDLADAREVAWAKVRRGIRQHSAYPDRWRPALLRTPEDVEEWALAEFDLHCQKIGLRVLRDLPQTEALRILGAERDSAKATALASLEFMDVDEDDSQADTEIHPVRLDFTR